MVLFFSIVDKNDKAESLVASLCYSVNFFNTLDNPTFILTFVHKQTCYRLTTIVIIQSYTPECI